ncbi:MAG: hypothetical protein O3C68_10255 [Proteobacteria bacterium]|nr:hypothetical protein [Pseudomonadota bacterium]
MDTFVTSFAPVRAELLVTMRVVPARALLSGDFPANKAFLLEVPSYKTVGIIDE